MDRRHTGTDEDRLDGSAGKLVPSGRSRPSLEVADPPHTSCVVRRQVFGLASTHPATFTRHTY
jgi:hypothetical protein